MNTYAEKLEANLQIISMHPASFPYYDKTKIARRCVLSPQTSIYYRDIPDENKVVILLYLIIGEIPMR